AAVEGLGQFLLTAQGLDGLIEDGLRVLRIFRPGWSSDEQHQRRHERATNAVSHGEPRLVKMRNSTRTLRGLERWLYRGGWPKAKKIRRSNVGLAAARMRLCAFAASG